MKKPVIPAVLVLVGFLLLSGPFPARGESPDAAPEAARAITPVELAEMLRTKDFLLVNVRVPYAGEIPQTDAFIPYDQTSARLADYPANRNARVIVYCLAGRMARIAANALAAAGYKNVWVLDGGMMAWEKAHLALLHRNSPPSLPYPSASKDSGGPVPEPCGCGVE